MIKNKQSLIAKTLLFISTIIWGSSYFICKNALDELPVFFLLSIRFLISFIILFLFCVKNWKKINLSYLLKGALTGVFLGGAYIFQTIGLKYSNPGNTAFLTTIYCVIVPFLMWIINKKIPTKFNFISSFICFLGVGIVCLGEKSTISFMGEGMVLIGGIFFALQIASVSKFSNELDMYLYTTFQFLFAFLVCFIFFLIFEKFPHNISINSSLSLLYISVFATLISFVLMNVGIKNTSPVSASLILSLESVFGVIFSVIFYKQVLTIQSIIGFIVIFIGIILCERK